MKRININKFLYISRINTILVVVHVPKRVIDKEIIALLNEFGKAMRFTDFYKTFARRGTLHHQTDIWKNLELLMEQKKIIKVRWYAKKYYGIPEERQDGTRFVVVTNGYETEEVEVKE
jgi:hypothetical protein